MILGALRRGLLGLLLALGQALPAVAATSWEISPADSEVLFDFQRGDNAGTGRFTRFDGRGSFDPAHPETATLEVRIETASIDVDDAVVSNFATTEEYFASEQYPHVVYRLLRLTPQGGDRYQTEGELTIRSFTRPVQSTITLRIDGDTARATGVLSLQRKEFHFGVGPSSLFVNLGPEVAVRFALTAHRLW